MASAGLRLFLGQQDFVHLELLLRGRRKTLTPLGLAWNYFPVEGKIPVAFAWQVQHFVQMDVRGAALGNSRDYWGKNT